jgi:hypothetical protein
VDGPGLAEKAAAGEREKLDNAALLRAALGDFPLSVVEFAPTGEVKPGARGGLDATFRYAVNQDAYRKYVARLDQVLRKVAVRSGDVTFRIPWGRDTLGYRAPGFTPQGAKVLEAVLKDERQTGCRLLFVARGKIRSFGDAPSPIHRYHLLDATWYLLPDGLAAVPPRAWARGKQLRLRCTLRDGQGGEVARLVVHPYRWVSGQTGKVLYPGGPLAWYISNGTLSLSSSWREFEERKNRGLQRVMALLPVFLLRTGQGGLPFREAAEFRVHFDVSPDQVRDVRGFTVEPALPDEEPG